MTAAHSSQFKIHAIPNTNIKYPKSSSTKQNFQLHFKNREKTGTTGMNQKLFQIEKCKILSCQSKIVNQSESDTKNPSIHKSNHLNQRSICNLLLACRMSNHFECFILIACRPLSGSGLPSDYGITTINRISCLSPFQNFK